jgi:hypothetical protein
MVVAASAFNLLAVVVGRDEFWRLVEKVTNRPSTAPAGSFPKPEPASEITTLPPGRRV